MSDPTEESSYPDEQFVRLFTQHENDLYRYVLSLVFNPSAVDDIMQDVAVSIWNKFADYDTSRPFMPWACRFAYFQVLKFRQRIGTSKLVFGETLLEHLADDYNAECELMAARRSALDICLAQLPKEDRELIQLRYGSKETIQNLSKRTRISVHKLYHTLDRIRNDLMVAVNQTLRTEGWDEVR
jgi:RNA polymerase sigma-70 factor (ECF subfamily)